jgi:hypothetical protein
MTFDDPGEDPFGHLDDPVPPMHGAEALTHVVARGQQIRRRRRTAYSASTALIVVVIAGAAVGVARSGAHNSQTISTLKSGTPSVTASELSSTPKRSQSSGPGGGVTTTTGPIQHQHSLTTSPNPTTTPTCSSTPTAAPGSPAAGVTANAVGKPKSGTSLSPTPTAAPTCIPPSVTPTPSTSVSATPTSTPSDLGSDPAP